jgi:hypothetical protein
MWGYLGNHAQNGSKLIRERSFDLRMLHTSSPARNLKGCGLIWTRADANGWLNAWGNTCKMMGT